MEYTTNYHLPQWQESDRIQMEDFNRMCADMEAGLDAVKSEAEEGRQALSESMQTSLSEINNYLGGSSNCRIASGSYTGNGTYGKANPVVLTFDFTPRFLVVGSKENSSKKFDKLMYPHPYGVMGNDGTAANLTWGTNSISWYNTDTADRQLNASGTKYYYVAFGNTDA